jgi:hypothetical protein
MHDARTAQIYTSPAAGARSSYIWLLVQYVRHPVAKDSTVLVIAHVITQLYVWTPGACVPHPSVVVGATAEQDRRRQYQKQHTLLSIFTLKNTNMTNSRRLPEQFSCCLLGTALLQNL